MMRLLILIVCCVSALLISSCRSSTADKRNVDVIIDGDGQFPEFLVGKWKADKGGWEIVFEHDGTISSAVVSLGRIKLEPGRVTTVSMRLGGEGIFEPGLWTVQYLQEQWQLIVDITIAHFRTEMGDSVLQGQTRDFFIGKVSTDGQFWSAERYSFPEYIVDTEKYHSYKLPFDPNDNPRESLVFQKVSE